MKFKLALIVALIVLTGSFVSAESVITNTNYNYGSYSTYNVQSYQPTISNLYSSSEISQYWPVLNSQNTAQCFEN